MNASLSRILVVEDDPTIRDCLAELLDLAGYDVITAPHGAAALERLDDAAQPPALILLDMQMPVMDGWEFAAAYRQRPGPHAPIVVVTAAVDATGRGSAVDALRAIPKPFDVDEILDVADQCCGAVLQPLAQPEQRPAA